MTITQVDAIEAALRGYTHIVTIGHADLTDADTAQTIAILPDPTSDTSQLIEKEVSCVGIDITEQFAATSLSALTVIVGDDGNDDRFYTAALADLYANSGFYSAPYSVSTQPYTYKAANTVDAIFTSTGANLDACTAGEVKLFLKVTNR